MRSIGNTKGIGVSPYWRIAGIMVICAIIYYLPTFASIVGWTSAHGMLDGLHDFYGIDFYALVFFVPVVYAAYLVGVGGAVITALVAMLLILPYAIVVTNYAGALFRPTSFAIILSAVGAVIAMLQKNDEQRHRSLSELKCLYNVGKATEESHSVDEFLSAVVKVIPPAIQYREKAGVRIVMGDKTFESPGFSESSNRIVEDLVVGGEVLGKVEVFSTRRSPYLKADYPLIKTLVEIISRDIHGIELEISLEGYYEQLEEMVDKRTKDLEQAQEKLIRSERLAAVGELASGVGHELRNPLNVIRNCVYLLNMSLNGKTDEDITGTLKLLDQQVDISNKIVTDLLNFTRVRPPTLAKVDLNKLVKESLSWLTVPENVAVVHDFNGTSPQIMVDAEQVGRAFANIISNAIQAISGRGQLRISTGTEDSSAWVKFDDSGCGIPEENMEKLFEPLFTTKPRGIGLGLAITRRLIEQNSGTIEVTSQVDKGTTFTVRLPLQKKEDMNERARCECTGS